MVPGPAETPAFLPRGTPACTSRCPGDLSPVTSSCGLSSAPPPGSAAYRGPGDAFRAPRAPIVPRTGGPGRGDRSHTSALLFLPQECRVLKNFSSLYAILSALQSNSIHRLKKTWEEVSRWAGLSRQELQGTRDPPGGSESWARPAGGASEGPLALGQQFCLGTQYPYLSATRLSHTGDFPVFTRQPHHSIHLKSKWVRTDPHTQSSPSPGPQSAQGPGGPCVQTTQPGSLGPWALK